MNPLVESLLLILSRSLVTQLQRRKDTRQNAEDVVQELFCDILRQPKTMEFIVKNQECIRQGVIPGHLLDHYRSKARSSSSKSKREVSLSDEKLFLAHELRASQEESFLIELEPFPVLSKLLEAYQYGCKNNKEVYSGPQSLDH